MQVNEKKTNTRSRILAILRDEPAPVSGETIAETLGLSRVAVWKAVKSLNEAGYGIASGQDGYCLALDKEDSVYPWEFGSVENLIRHFDETASTMDQARAEALGGCENGLIVLAERQSAGRGTGAKKWESPAGGLFFTMVTRPEIQSAYSHRLVLKAQLALIDAIKTTTGIAAFPGWPNDILTENGKAGGILAESLSSGNRITFLDLGVGINTGERPVLKSTETAGIAQPVSIPVGRKKLLDAFLASFSSINKQFPEGKALDHGDSLVRAWNAKSTITGKPVRYHSVTGNSRNSMQTGIFRGIDEAGWAVIEQDTETYRCPPGSIALIDKGVRP